MVPLEKAGERLDRYLSDALPGLSRTRIQQLIGLGLVSLRGAEARPSARLKGNEGITVLIPPPRPLDLVPEGRPIGVLFEDDHLMVVEKPAGMVVHPAPGHGAGTLVHVLLSRPGSLSGIGGVGGGGRAHCGHPVPVPRILRGILPPRVPAGDGPNAPGSVALRPSFLSDRGGRRLREAAEDRSGSGQGGANRHGFSFSAPCVPSGVCPPPHGTTDGVHGAGPAGVRGVPVGGPGRGAVMPRRDMPVSFPRPLRRNRPRAEGGDRLRCLGGGLRFVARRAMNPHVCARPSSPKSSAHTPSCGCSARSPSPTGGRATAPRPRGRAARIVARHAMHPQGCARHLPESSARNPFLHPLRRNRPCAEGGDRLRCLGGGLRFVARRAMNPHVCAKGDIPLLEYHVEECPPPTAPPGPLLRPLRFTHPPIAGEGPSRGGGHAGASPGSSSRPFSAPS